MPHRPVIDGFEFARAGSRLSGGWPLNDFPRLREALYGDSGALQYELLGVPEEQGRPALHLSVRGTLQLLCQRCLEAMRYELRTESALLLYPSEAELGAAAEAEAAGPEKILGGKEMPVRDLIEDEVLLSIPYAPRHERCAGRRLAETRLAGTTPFAGLRGLLGAHEPDKEKTMAVPQNRKTPSKRGMHRSHDRLASPPLAIEPTTGEVHLRHHLSPTGYYRGKKIAKVKGE